jgi:hypothetical protein
MIQCNRCKAWVDSGTEQSCWYCVEPLCYRCWDDFSHCGHKEADEANEKAKNHGVAEWEEDNA